jgi:uncharacterized protein
MPAKKTSSTKPGLALVGRDYEKEVLDRLYGSGKPEFVALHGRRRIGKTYLIRRHFEGRITFELVGNSRATLGEQLQNFAAALSAAAGIRAAVPRSWQEAFSDLTAYLERLPAGKKRVLFFDEFPWLASPRSRFLPAFEHFWNAWASKRPELMLIITGSAAAWMLRHVVGDRGGLHARVTRQLQLMPFNLHDTAAFLESRGVRWKQAQIVELYMAVGGVPYYLEQVRGSLSAAQNIDQLCFNPKGALHEEFQRLYASLFEGYQEHLRIIAALAAVDEGLSRDELLVQTGLSSGGGMSQMLEELEAGGFIASTAPFRKASRDRIYRLVDEFSLFHHAWMKPRSKTAAGRGHWLQVRGTPRWRNWSGHAFEMLCLKHGQQLRRALGISGMQTTLTAWRHRPRSKKDGGAQIDLLIDRADNTINLCEMKFTYTPFPIDKAYAATLNLKRDIFQRHTRTRKTLFLTMVTSSGLVRNELSDQLIQSSIEMSALFEPD